VTRLHFDAPRSAWWRRALVVSVAALLLFGAWWAGWTDRPAAPDVPASQGVPLPTAPLPAPVVLTATSPSLPPATARVLPSPPAASAPGGRRIEVCGRGPMTMDDIERTQPVEAVAARQQLTSSLLQGSERERVLGLLMSVDGLAIESLDRSSKTCAPQDRDCAQVMRGQVRAAAQPMLDAVVETALASRDPGVYGMAFVLACRGGDAEWLIPLPPSCARLSAQQWRQRDPGDATPALWAARQAQQRGDAAAVDAALAAAVASPRRSWTAGDLQQVLLSHTGFAGLPAPQRAELVWFLQGLTTASSEVPTGPLLQRHACTAAALADPGRRERCDALVRHLLAHSQTLVDFSLATRNAQRLGWAPERLRDLEDQRLALMQALRPPLSPELIYTCEGVRQMTAHYAEVARHGEVGAARRLIEASGRPLSDWADEARAAQARMAAAFGGAPASSPQR
jgi:hypothetical protein